MEKHLWLLSWIPIPFKIAFGGIGLQHCQSKFKCALNFVDWHKTVWIVSYCTIKRQKKWGCLFCGMLKQYNRNRSEVVHRYPHRCREMQSDYQLWRLSHGTVQYIVGYGIRCVSSNQKSKNSSTGLQLLHSMNLYCSLLQILEIWGSLNITAKFVLLHEV